MRKFVWKNKIAITACTLTIAFGVGFWVLSQAPTETSVGDDLIVAGSVGIGTISPSERLEVNGYIESENLFSEKKDIGANRYFTLNFPDWAFGICSVRILTIGYGTFGLYHFSTHSSANVVYTELNDYSNNINVTASGNKMKFKSTSAYCVSNSCQFTVTCNGYNLYPMTVTDES